MDRWLIYAVTFAVAGLLATWFTPRVRSAAIRFGIVDRPDGKLKTQREPVPYLGGLAIYVSFLIALALTLHFDERVLGILLAGSIMVILGLIDDLGQLGPWTKLAGQLVAVSVLIKSGIYIQLTFLPPLLAMALSVIWLLAVTNAFNLIDVMDGLSAGSACIASLVLLVVADLDGGITAATLLAALGGACFGFVRYNFAPARIYMGDSGSLFIGMLLGALAMDNSYTRHNRLGALAPALVLGLPLFDMVFVMYIRRLRGLPIMMGSPDHIALRLRNWRLSTRQTVILSYGVSALLGVAALALTLLSQTGAVVVLAVVSMGAFVSGLWLKRLDVRL